MELLIKLTVYAMRIFILILTVPPGWWTKVFNVAGEKLMSPIVVNSWMVYLMWLLVFGLVFIIGVIGWNKK